MVAGLFPAVKDRHNQRAEDEDNDGNEGPGWDHCGDLLSGVDYTIGLRKMQLELFEGGGVAQGQAELFGAQEAADDFAGAGFWQGVDKLDLSGVGVAGEVVFDVVHNVLF